MVVSGFWKASTKQARCLDNVHSCSAWDIKRLIMAAEAAPQAGKGGALLMLARKARGRGPGGRSHSHCIEMFSARSEARSI